MIELYSRGIKLDDLQFITDELKEGARAGHYAKELLDPVSFNGLVESLRKTFLPNIHLKPDVSHLRHKWPTCSRGEDLHSILCCHQERRF